MPGEIDLDKILESLNPELSEEEYIFCTSKNKIAKLRGLEPWAIIEEQEGTTYILERRKAESNKIDFESVFKRITITVYSSLNSVGLTAVISRWLSECGISANFVSGYYHDHVFVPIDRAEEAERIIMAIGNR